MTAEWLYPTIPAALSAAFGGLVYRHQRREARAVSWRLKETDAGHYIERVGGGTAYDVDIDISQAEATSWLEDELHHEEVGPNETLRVGRFVTANSDMAPQRIQVRWKTRKRFGRQKTWRTVLS